MMIPKLRPYYNWKEIFAAFSFDDESVYKFEEKFAKYFNVKHAVSFSYGRGGLYALMKALGYNNAETIMPAYTCTVVPNAVALSGNIPKFVDVSLKDYNMDIFKFKKRISKKTKVVIPTSLFGYPMDPDEVNSIAKNKLIVQDCALAFGATKKGKLVANQGDVAFYGMGIGKHISVLDGGMFTTDDFKIYTKLKDYRDKNYKTPTLYRKSYKLFYFLGLFAVLNNLSYNVVYYLWKNTKLLHPFTQYYSGDKISLPEDYNIKLTNIQARLGIEQLKKLPEILEKRRRIVKYYNSKLKDLQEIELPPIIEGASYSHYCPRVKERDYFLEQMAKRGINCGYNFEYAVPDLKAYLKFKDKEFPNATKCGAEIVNLPNYPGLRKKEQKHIISSVIDVFS